MMVVQFAEVCRRGLKVNAGKSKMMLLNGEEGLKYEVYEDKIYLEHVPEFKYLRYVLDESECNRKVASRKKVVSTIRSLVNSRNLQLEYASLS